MKPLEVEILVAELGLGTRPNQLFHVGYEGTITDEDRFAVLGGEAEAIREQFAAAYRDGWGLAEALKASAQALAGGDRTLAADALEAAVLSEGNGRRTFRRLSRHRARPAPRLVGPSPHRRGSAPLRSRRWSAASSGSRTSTASPSPCGASAA